MLTSVALLELLGMPEWQRLPAVGRIARPLPQHN
jgi:hypothetical protein